MSRKREVRWDHIGRVVLMASRDGYCMVRRPGAMPFVINKTAWMLMETNPYVGPCGARECSGGCYRADECGEPCKPAEYRKP